MKDLWLFLVFLISLCLVVFICGCTANWLITNLYLKFGDDSRLFITQEVRECNELVIHEDKVIKTSVYYMDIKGEKRSITIKQIGSVDWLECKKGDLIYVYFNGLTGRYEIEKKKKIE